MELSLIRKWEIEVEFSKTLSKKITREDVLSDLVLKIKSIEESAYLFEAYQMPFEEIFKELEIYDASRPRLDEVKFVDNLGKRYNVDRETIVQRIQNVRAVNRYLILKKITLNQDEKTKIKKI